MLEDTARTLTTVLSSGVGIDGNINVASITPPGTPGVSDLDDLDTVHDSPTNSVNGVVELTIDAVAEDTTGVLHELLVSVNSDGKRTVHKSCLHSGNTVRGYTLGGTVSLNSSVRGSGGASTNRGSVFVVFLRPEGVGSVGNSVEDGSRPSTVATVATTVSAVNNLLLGEGDETIASDGVVGLKDLGGGESVAGTAGSLVLDGNNVLITPDA